MTPKGAPQPTGPAFTQPSSAVPPPWPQSLLHISGCHCSCPALSVAVDYTSPGLLQICFLPRRSSGPESPSAEGCLLTSDLLQRLSCGPLLSAVTPTTLNTWVTTSIPSLLCHRDETEREQRKRNYFDSWFWKVPSIMTRSFVAPSRAAYNMAGKSHGGIGRGWGARAPKDTLQ